jgi:putative DNA primase/helicase
MSADLFAEFRTAMLKAGITPPDSVIADGELHRFATNGKASDDAGWYVLYVDGLPAGAFGDFRTGAEGT